MIDKIAELRAFDFPVSSETAIEGIPEPVYAITDYGQDEPIAVHSAQTIAGDKHHSSGKTKCGQLVWRDRTRQPGTEPVQQSPLWFCKQTLLNADNRPNGQTLHIGQHQPDALAYAPSD